MSVLSKMIRDREEWANRQKVLVERHNHTKVVADQLMAVFICMLPFIVFMFRDKILLLLKHLMH